MPKRLAEEGPVDEAMRSRFGATIEAEARRMLRIVEDLMSLSRIEADRYRRPTNRSTWARWRGSQSNMRAPLADRRGCRIEAQIEDRYPVGRRATSANCSSLPTI